MNPLLFQEFCKDSVLEELELDSNGKVVGIYHQEMFSGNLKKKVNSNRKNNPEFVGQCCHKENPLSTEYFYDALNLPTSTKPGGCIIVQEHGVFILYPR